MLGRSETPKANHSSIAPSDECPACGDSLSHRHHALQDVALVLELTDHDVAHIVQHHSAAVCKTPLGPMVSCNSLVWVAERAMFVSTGREATVREIRLFDDAPCVFDPTRPSP